eukprot:15335364-Alexandrium_andersonii.AAC.1
MRHRKAGAGEADPLCMGTSGHGRGNQLLSPTLQLSPCSVSRASCGRRCGPAPPDAMGSHPHRVATAGARALLALVAVVHVVDALLVDAKDAPADEHQDAGLSLIHI